MPAHLTCSSMLVSVLHKRRFRTLHRAEETTAPTARDVGTDTESKRRQNSAGRKGTTAKKLEDTVYTCTAQNGGEVVGSANDVR
jgi:hypothetical protein